MPHSLDSIYLRKLSFSAEDASTLQRIGEYKGKQALYTQQTPEILESLRQVAIVESSESSNRLEGITAPRERVEALVRKTSMPATRSEQEIAGYRDALALIHESAAHMVFTVNVVLQLHSMIYRYLPAEGGRWKMTDNEIVERNPDGSLLRVRFRAVPAVATPGAMDQLVERYRAAIAEGRVEPLVAAPLAVFDFLCIHPFTDGNGRTARLVTLLLLYHFGYEVGRYISLERIFEESRETYYETLEASSRGWHQGQHDIRPWLRYFWGVMLRAYREFEERVGKITTGRGSKTAHIRRVVDRKLAPFAISEIEAECPGISRDMIRVVLRKMREDGVLTVEGAGRGARWSKRHPERADPARPDPGTQAGRSKERG
jgi:Fic family protein